MAGARKHTPGRRPGPARRLLGALLLVAACAPATGAPPQPPNAGGSSVAGAPATRSAPAGGGVAPAPAGGGAGQASAGSGATTAPPAVAPLSPPLTLKVGSLTLVGEAGVFDALAKGYFREEGLEVELVPFRTTSEMTAPLATGELSFASGPPDPSLFNAVLRDVSLRIVGYNAIISTRDTSGGWTVRQDLLDSGRYQGPQDLKGMTIPLSAQGNIGQIWIERVLAKGGLTLADVNTTQLSFPDIPAAFANKGIDAGFVVEPFVTVAENMHAATNVIPSGQIYPGLVAMTMIASPVFVREQPEGTRRFVTAYLRGQRDYYHAIMKNEGGKEELFQILAQYTPIHETSLFERMATHDVDPNGALDPKTIDEQQDYYLRYGTQQQKVDLTKVLDPSYSQYAVERLGRVQ